MTVGEEYLSSLIASSECHLEVLFWVACSLLGQGGLGDLLQGQAEQFVQHLMDKDTRIHSQLDLMCGDAQEEILPCYLVSLIHLALM